MQNKFALVVSRIILLVLIFVSGYLTLAGMFSTVCLTDTEHVYFCVDNPVIHIIAAVIVVLLITALSALKGKSSMQVCSAKSDMQCDSENDTKNAKLTEHSILKRFPGIVLTLYFLLLTYIVLSTNLVPTFDQLHVSEAAIGLLNNDFSSFLPGGYARLWDNQSGFILYLAGVYALFGEGNVIAVSLLNVIYSTISLGLIYVLARRMVPKFANAILVASALFMPMWFFATFVYGTMPSLMLSLIAMAEFTTYETSSCMNAEDQAESRIQITKQTAKLPGLKHILLGSISISLATVLKTNALIYMLAILVYEMVCGVSNLIERDRFATDATSTIDGGKKITNADKRIKSLCSAFIAIIMIVIFYVVCNKAVGFTMRSITGMDNLAGTPRTAHIAMGLQESSNKSSGWFNGYNQAVFEENNYDHDAANAAAIDNIKQSLNRFASAPSNAVGFFLKKIVSQWCEPTCESLFVLMSRNSLTIPAKWLEVATIGGVGSAALINIMNVVQNLLYFGTLIFAIWAVLNTEKIKFAALLPAITFLGGFCFHLIWEANSQYTLVYEILLIGYAVSGFWLISNLKTVKKPYMTLQNGVPIWTALIVAVAAIVIAICPEGSIVGRSFKMNWSSAEYEAYRSEVCAPKVARVAGLSDGRYRISSAMTGATCGIDEESGYTVCGDFGDNTKWFVTYNSDGYTFRYQTTQKVLDIDCASTEPGTRAQQWDYNGDVSQRFEIRDAQDGTFVILYAGNMALTLDDKTGNVVIEEYTGESSQLWRFE